jgi:hypothetical protein
MQEIQETGAQERIIQQGNTLVKLENDTQMAISIQRPRDEAGILTKALRELDLYPSMSEEAIYNKPVGKDDKGNKVYAEGLSIRTAESLANRWSNSAYGADIVGEDEESATIAAVFLDYENNTRHVMQSRVSKFYTTREKKVVQLTPDRFDMKIKAEQSKLLREVILRSLPAGLKREYRLKAEKLLKGDKINTRRTALVERFHELGVSVEQLVAYKCAEIKDWKHSDITEMLGVYNAIRDGEVNVEEAFKQKQKENDKPDLKTQGNLI